MDGEGSVWCRSGSARRRVLSWLLCAAVLIMAAFALSGRVCDDAPTVDRVLPGATVAAHGSSSWATASDPCGEKAVSTHPSSCLITPETLRIASDKLVFTDSHSRRQDRVLDQPEAVPVRLSRPWCRSAGLAIADLSVTRV